MKLMRTHKSTRKKKTFSNHLRFIESEKRKKKSPFDEERAKLNSLETKQKAIKGEKKTHK